MEYSIDIFSMHFSVLQLHDKKKWIQWWILCAICPLISLFDKMRLVSTCSSVDRYLNLLNNLVDLWCIPPLIVLLNNIWYPSWIMYMLCFHKQVTLKDNENEMSRRLKKVLEKFRSTDCAYYQLCHLVRQGEHPKEGFFLLSNLFEDQMGANIGYADWMLQISRQVQQA